MVVQKNGMKLTWECINSVLPPGLFNVFKDRALNDMREKTESTSMVLFL